MRLAMQFAQGKGSALAAGGAASVVLAEEVVRAIVMTKVKVAAAMILLSAVFISGAAAWAGRERGDVAPVGAANAAISRPNPEPEVIQAKAPDQPEWVTRTIRGIVRDERGKPVAKAWIGQSVELQDKYLRLQPLPSSDAPARQGAESVQVRRCSSLTPVAIEMGQYLSALGTTRRRLVMRGLGGQIPADRTDPLGSFRIAAKLSTLYSNEIHIASPDFAQDAVRVVQADDPDRPLEITVRPVRTVRAQVIVRPKGAEGGVIEWHLYTVDSTAGKLKAIPAISAKGAHWGSGSLDDSDPADKAGEQLEVELRVPPGRYQLNFPSETLYRTVDIVVPPGNGSLRLPDIGLESSAWFRALGKAAPELEAVGADGKPARLADYRGKVVVLAFWSAKVESGRPFIGRLAEFQKRFKGQPLEILRCTTRR